jgi:hypothetical protein
MRYVPNANNKHHVRVYAGYGFLGNLWKTVSTNGSRIVKAGAKAALGAAQNQLKNEEFRKQIVGKIGDVAASGANVLLDKAKEKLDNMTNKTTDDVLQHDLDDVTQQGYMIVPRPKTMVSSGINWGKVFDKPHKKTKGGTLYPLGYKMEKVGGSIVYK